MSAYPYVEFVEGNFMHGDYLTLHEDSVTLAFAQGFVFDKADPEYPWEYECARTGEVIELDFCNATCMLYKPGKPGQRIMPVVGL